MQAWVRERMMRAFLNAFGKHPHDWVWRYRIDWGDPVEAPLAAAADRAAGMDAGSPAMDESHARAYIAQDGLEMSFPELVPLPDAERLRRVLLKPANGRNAALRIESTVSEHVRISADTHRG